MHDEHGERAVASGGGLAGPGDAFCVVISSIPGYAFCGPSRQLGWDTERRGAGGPPTSLGEVRPGRGSHGR
jgi:hypothetical protein